MNIFVLDNNPVTAAQMACDKHVVKMILESAQMLCSPFESGTAPYKRTHYNHPCSIWARASRTNYDWLIAHALALCAEYEIRYGPNKQHKSKKIVEWCNDNKEKLGLSDLGLTEFALAIPDDCKANDVTSAYRRYYVKHKAGFAKWTKRNVPEWFLPLDNG